jgi:hypothetical protein
MTEVDLKKYRTVFVDEPFIDTQGVPIGAHIPLRVIDGAVDLWSKLGWTIHTISQGGSARSQYGAGFFITFEIEAEPEDEE